MRLPADEPAVGICTDLGELEPAAWDRLTARPPASIAGSREWVTAAFAHAHPAARPHLLAVSGRPGLVAVLPLALHDAGAAPTLRFAGAPHNDLADLLVLPGYEDAAARAVLEAVRGLAHRGWTVKLEDVDPHGVLAAADRELRLMTWRPSDPAPVVDLHGEWQRAASSRRRAQWDRKLRRLREAHRVEVRRLEGGDALRSLPAFLRLREARRMATGRPPERKPTAFLVDVVRRLAPVGRCALMELSLDGIPAAIDLYQVDRPVAMMWVRGLDPRWRAFPCGHLLLRATAEALADDGFDALDLGRGDEPYKFVFGGDRRVLLEGETSPAGERG